jgi:uncharacterized NAD(P)/FAD-binding protein YdhS
MEQDVAIVGGGTTPVVAAVPLVTLNEFCTRLSMTDRRVELIGGFHFTETQAGRLKDAESNYQARYTAFLTKPV